VWMRGSCEAERTCIYYSPREQEWPSLLARGRLPSLGPPSRPEQQRLEKKFAAQQLSSRRIRLGRTRSEEIPAVDRALARPEHAGCGRVRTEARPYPPSLTPSRRDARDSQARVPAPRRVHAAQRSVDAFVFKTGRGWHPGVYTRNTARASRVTGRARRPLLDVAPSQVWRERAHRLDTSATPRAPGSGRSHHPMKKFWCGVETYGASQRAFFFFF
jgi:hypothetical protein